MSSNRWVNPINNNLLQDLEKNVLPLGTLEFYAAGTSTAKAVYSDPEQTVSIGSVLTADAFGFIDDFHFESGEQYKAVAKDAEGVAQWTRDNLTAGGQSTEQIIQLATPTGTVSFFIGVSAPNGWLALDGATIGDGGTGADYEGGDYEPLYLHLWDQLADTEAAVSGGRGSTAEDDWMAGKTLTLPDERDNFLRGLPASGRRLGEFQDEQFKEHNHEASVTGGAHGHDSTSEKNLEGTFSARASSAGITNVLGRGHTGGIVSIDERAGDPQAHVTLDSGEDVVDIYEINATHDHSVASAGSGHSHDASIENAGGTETRPVNSAYLICVKL